MRGTDGDSGDRRALGLRARAGPHRAAPALRKTPRRGVQPGARRCAVRLQARPHGPEGSDGQEPRRTDIPSSRSARPMPPRPRQPDALQGPRGAEAAAARIRGDGGARRAWPAPASRSRRSARARSRRSPSSRRCRTEDRESFTKEHASFENPGVTLSPDGPLPDRDARAATRRCSASRRPIELHHARLVKYFGQDPFAGQPGLVRIVPESSGLEARRHAVLVGRRLPVRPGHDGEVLVRHDRRARPRSHARADAPVRRGGQRRHPVVARRGQGRLDGGGLRIGRGRRLRSEPRVVRAPSRPAFLKGYGDENKLKKLVEGTLDDYRDNYTAGYALFLFLVDLEGEGRRALRRSPRELRAGLPGEGRQLARVVHRRASATARADGRRTSRRSRRSSASS